MRDYDLILRLDPFPRPREEAPSGLPIVRVFVNGSLVSRLDLRWNPERVGSYDIHVPRSVVKNGFNRLELLADLSSSGSSIDGRSPQPRFGGWVSFLLWYVQVLPQG
jgi:hypothetical protein